MNKGYCVLHLHTRYDSILDSMVNPLKEKGGDCLLSVKAKKLKHRKYHSVIHANVYITDDRFKTNIVCSSTSNTNDPWIIATNCNTSKAIKSYAYRFASIEAMFKAQKGNGFNLEKISNSNLDNKKEFLYRKAFNDVIETVTQNPGKMNGSFSVALICPVLIFYQLFL